MSVEMSCQTLTVGFNALFLNLTSAVSGTHGSQKKCWNKPWRQYIYIRRGCATEKVTDLGFVHICMVFENLKPILRTTSARDPALVQC